MKKMITTAVSEEFALEYFSVLQEFEGDDKSPIQTYGILAAKYVNGKLTEEECSGPISHDPAQVNDLINILAKNTVTPAVLCEILDELL